MFYIVSLLLIMIASGHFVWRHLAPKNGTGSDYLATRLARQKVAIHAQWLHVDFSVLPTTYQFADKFCQRDSPVQ